MSDPADTLTVQLLEWIADRPRTYSEVLAVWRTSCPRLSIWEDACIEGLIHFDPEGDRIVTPSAKGRAMLDARRKLAPGAPVCGDHRPP